VSKDLKVLADNRDALLLAEIAAWLHMVGKLHEEFLEGDLRLATKIPDDLKPCFPHLYQLLTDTWTGEIWDTLPVTELQATNISISQLNETHQNIKGCKYGFLKLFADTHGRGSGTEKGVLARFAPKQEKIVYSSTSLGYETNTNIDLTQILDERQKFYTFLEVQLDNLKRNSAKLGHDEWVRFRHDFIQRIEQSFRSTVAETRRPLNDVTLLDQTMATVAFFKAALAYILLKGWKEPGVGDVAEKHRWRLLRVGLDGLSFWGNSIRISDILARRKLITESLDEVKILLETTYPLGMEVYRDENGSIFIIPDIDDLPSYIDDSTQTLGDQIQSIALRIFADEAKFIKLLPSENTRNTLSFGQAVVRPLPPPQPDINSLTSEWRDQKRVKDICPVCGLRPQSLNTKASTRKICDICAKRRDNRSEQWFKNLSSTIWIDEIADSAGRLALLTAQFDLSSWLSGTIYNTIHSFDIAPRTLEDPGRNNKKYDFKFNDLITDIKNGLTYRGKPPAFNDESPLGKLVLSANRDQTANTVQAFYDIRIVDTDLAGIDTSKLSREERLALEMVRLSPSFSRLYRVWHTTQTFWQEIISDFKAETQVGEISPRLRIRGVFKGRGERLGISHTYELKMDNVNLSITSIADGEFLTVDNLQRTSILLNVPEESHNDYSSAARHIQRHLLHTRSFDLEEPTGYGSPNKLLGKFQVTDVVIEPTPYVPAISLLTEPRTFMAIVPADKAIEVTKAIKAKYEKEMGKVRNRLPLTLGIVFAERRTPLPAILDAGRRMLKQPTDGETWTIDKVDPYPQKIELTMKKDGQTITIAVPIMMGDGKTKDVWYPYWQVNDIKGLSRTRQFTGADGKQWVHVQDLLEGDSVSFRPSRFDFEFLDTAARRFEVSYDNGKRRGSQRPSRPYYLEQLKSFEWLWNRLSDKTCGLTTSQIHNLIGIIETKRIEWAIDQNDGSTRETFVRFVSETLNDAEWKEHLNEDEMKLLRQAAVSGQLADVVELYIRILKKDGGENL